jgi:hypothetical protein
MTAVADAEDPSSPTSHQKHIQALVDAKYRTQDEGNAILKAIEDKAGTITGTTAFDPTGDPRTSRQYGSDFSKAKQEFDHSAELGEMIGNFMPRAIATPDAVGGTARIAQQVSAAASLLGKDATGAMLVDWLTSTDQETLQSMRTQLQIIRGRVRPIATGDSGTRQSDSERKIASEVTGLIERVESPIDLLKNYPQVMGSLKQLYIESYVTRYNKAAKWDEIDYPFDLSTEAGQLAILKDFSDAGVDRDAALLGLDRLEQIQLKAK